MSQQLVSLIQDTWENTSRADNPWAVAGCDGAHYWCAVNHVQWVPVITHSKGESKANQFILWPLGGRSLYLLCIQWTDSFLFCPEVLTLCRLWREIWNIHFMCNSTSQISLSWSNSVNYCSFWSHSKLRFIGMFFGALHENCEGMVSEHKMRDPQEASQSY